jgi:ATP-binding cassette subfamily F protein 3
VSLVVASSLSLAYGKKVLFENAVFSIGPRDRIGLVGANGTGKSSLLRILAGEVTPDSGTLSFRRGARVGYLPQDVASLPAGPLVDTVVAAVPGRSGLETRLADTEAALHGAKEEAEQLELAQSLADLHAELDHFEEHYGRHRAERILVGLGFKQTDLTRSTAEFSGGWRMRAALAGLLLQDPDLLLLDEPTNHLDVPTLAWFDAFLRATGKAVLLISHDRVFLNRQIDQVMSLEPEGLREYSGDYEDYKEARALEEIQLRARAEKVEARREELQRFIDRFGAKNTKASQAQSKRKMLEKLETVDVLEHRATLKFRFPEPPRSGREVIRFEGVQKRYGQIVVYQNLDGQVLRGERIGVIGPNGAGKTTLLKLVAGELAPDAGTVTLGHGVAMGYYAQHHFERGADGGSLDPRRTVLETLWDLVPDKTEGHVRSVAGGFLFSGDDVEKPLGVLSGGERARVALAKLLLVPANLLVMDEPTNHLDLDSSEALIAALDSFAGTLLFVSHNQSFLNRLAKQIWEVKDGGIDRHQGNLDDWLARKRSEEAEAQASRQSAAAGGGGGGRQDRERKRAEAEARQMKSTREKPIKEEIARLEGRIAEVEAVVKEAGTALADPALYQDFARAKPLMDLHREGKAELDELYAAWEVAQEKLAAVARELGD